MDIEKLKHKLVKAGNCLEWIGGYNGRTPVIWIDGKARSLRRVVWEQYSGMQAGSRRVRVSCGNLCCANPEHLFVKNQMSESDASSSGGDHVQVE